MFCNAHDDMSNSSIRSKHQRCYTFDHSVRSDVMEDKNGARRPQVCCSGQQDPSVTPLPPRYIGSAGPTQRGGRHTPRSLISFSFFPSSLLSVSGILFSPLGL